MKRLNDLFKKDSTQTALSAFVILLFISNYQICEFFHKDDLTKWWILRTHIYSISFCLVLILSKVGKTGVTSLILAMGIGLTISDAVDRVISSKTTFDLVDIIMIVVTGGIALHDFSTNKYGTKKK